MRIALVSTPCVAVPPPRYGGTELVIAELAAALHASGQDVTVFATGDSRPAGRLMAYFPRACWPPDPYLELAQASWAAGEIRRAVPAFDVVHAHVDAFLPFAAGLDAPVLLTIHHDRHEGSLTLYAQFDDVTYVTISERQRAILPELASAVTVYHGLDPVRYPLGPGQGGYVAFLSRCSEQKGPHAAIDAARGAGVPILLGGGVHGPDQHYFDHAVRPRLTLPGVRYLGEVDHPRKLELLRPALAALFPLAWEEPFGLAMIEAMLCGTPVVAFPRGSVPEIVDEGITGFIVDDVAAMARAIHHCRGLDRVRVRARAAERWSAARMAGDYLRAYERALHRAARREVAPVPPSPPATHHRADARGSVPPTG